MSNAREGKTTSEEEYTRLEAQLKELQLEVEAQGTVVRTLKEQGGAESEVKKAVEVLKEKKAALDKLTKQWRAADPSKLHVDRKALDEVLIGRGFIIPGFEIYQGVAGLYDLGPPLCAIKSNFLNLWRQHFVMEENLLEIDTTCLTPAVVFKHSGHEKRFHDFMVKDTVTGTPHRCDKLLDEWLDTQLGKPELSEELRAEFTSLVGKMDDLGPDGMNALIRKHNILSTEGNPLSEPFPFNLMFATEIGPVGNNRAYLRPETAQGIFVNFRRLLDFNGGKMPFGAATVGQAFRNEIAPRSGLLRVREFTLAEIEFFRVPDDNTYEKVVNVQDVKLRLFSRERQGSGDRPVEMSIREALDQGVIVNEMLAYFLGRVQLFLTQCGILPDGLRFRQHLRNEMAHYASDCWDAELLTSFGWVEVVGCADRAAFDLDAHQRGSGKEMQAYQRFETPLVVDAFKATVKKAEMGKVFKKDAKYVFAHIEALENDHELGVQAQKALEETGSYTFSVCVDSGAQQSFTLTADLLKLEACKKNIDGRHYVPAVVEPSFGVGRILYGILEHTYWCREGDSKRSVFSLPPVIAPFKCAVLPLSAQNEFTPLVRAVASSLIGSNISCKVDDSGQSVGKRYARNDQLGVPFAVTVDFRSVEDKTVTLRERDSCTQIRLPMDKVASLVNSLLMGLITWQEVRQSGEYEEQEETASERVGKK